MFDCRGALSKDIGLPAVVLPTIAEAGAYCTTETTWIVGFAAAWRCTPRKSACAERYSFSRARR